MAIAPPPLMNVQSSTRIRRDGPVHPPAVRVTPGLDRDAVVVRRETHPANRHVLTRVGIAPVAVGAEAVDLHVLHEHVAAEHRVDVPHRRVAQGHARDDDARAAVRADETRTQVVPVTEDPLADRHAVVAHLREQRPVGALVGQSGVPAVLAGTDPVPPMLVVALGVEHACAGDADVSLTVRVDQGRVVVHLDPLPAGEHHGQVVGRVGTEGQCCPGADVQVDAAAQPDRTGPPAPRRNHHMPAAGAMAGGDRRGDGRRAIAVLACAELRDRELGIAKPRGHSVGNRRPQHRDAGADRTKPQHVAARQSVGHAVGPMR